MRAKRSRARSAYPRRYVRPRFMLLCIQPIFKIVTAACLFSHVVRFVSVFAKLFADGGYQGPVFKRLPPKSCRICNRNRQTLRSGKRVRASAATLVVERTFAWLNRCRGWPRIRNLAQNALAFSARLDSSHAQKTLSELMNFSDRPKLHQAGCAMRNCHRRIRIGRRFHRIDPANQPNARIIYNASDDLAVLGCAPFLLSELDRVAGCLDWARPSRALARGFTQDLPLYLIPHGSISEFGIRRHIPYGSGIHAVSVDQCFLMKASSYRRISVSRSAIPYYRPEEQQCAFAREHSCLREMKFTETVKYISTRSFVSLLTA